MISSKGSRKDVYMAKKQVRTKEVCFQNEQMYIYGKMFFPSVSEEIYDTIILAHGLGVNHTEMTDYARSFARAGFAAYIFDFRGGSSNSKSSGTSLDMSVKTEIEDLNFVIDCLATKTYVRRLVLFGESMGGFVAAHSAVERMAHIDKLILLYPAFVIPAQARKLYPKNKEIPQQISFTYMTVSRKYYEDARRMSSFGNVLKYEKDVLIFHGTLDDDVPVSYSRQASDLYKKAHYVEYEKAGHGFTGQDFYDTVNTTIRFLKGEPL